jgi:tetratricopeptide (TPR) repeat protein
MCAECHSTNLEKNYDPESNTYATTWSEIDVSCEACHGPGSQHVAWADIDPMGRPPVENFALDVVTSELDNREYVELCAPCHARRSEIADYQHEQGDLLQHYVPSLLVEGAYHPDGQILDEVYVWGSFTQSKMYQNDVLCGDCHDAHSLLLHQQGNALCAQCHQPSIYDTTAHHFHQLEGDGVASDGALCIKCHMPEQPYMVIDYRADHSLRIPRPDLSASLDVPNACSQSGCHDDQTLDWAIEAQTRWYGEARKPHYGTVLAAARNGDPAAEDGLIELAADTLAPVIVRATALNALAAYPPGRKDVVVRRALVDEASLLRHTAVLTITPDGQEMLAELVAPMLNDPVRAVRLIAASRLAAIPVEYLTAVQREALDRELAAYVESMRASLDFAASGLNLGNLYQSRGEPDTAEAYYRRAIEVDELFFPAKINLAMLLGGRGDIDETESLLRDVLQAYPEQYDAAYSLGLLLATSGRPEGALGYLEQAASGLPGHSRVHYNLGLLRAQLGQDAEAETSFLAALQLEPQNIDYLYALIDFYVRRDRLDEALVLTDEMIAAHPQERIGYDLQQFIKDRIEESGRQ